MSLIFIPISPPRACGEEREKAAVSLYEPAAPSRGLVHFALSTPARGLLKWGMTKVEALRVFRQAGALADGRFFLRGGLQSRPFQPDSLPRSLANRPSAEPGSK
jgi:hypothetical protein